MGFTPVNSMTGEDQSADTSTGHAARSSAPEVYSKSCFLKTRLDSTKSFTQSSNSNLYLFPQQKTKSSSWTDLNALSSEQNCSLEETDDSRARISGVLQAPVIKCEADEFADEYCLIRNLTPIGMEHGIVKLVPPRKWSSSLCVDVDAFWFRTFRQLFNQSDDGKSIEQSFNRVLLYFHERHRNNNGHFKFPVIERRPVDLHRMYYCVQRRGGFETVCRRKLWAQIGREMGYTGKIISSLSTTLKHIYQKSLLEFDMYLRENGVDMTNSPRLACFSITRRHTDEVQDETSVKILPNGIAVCLKHPISQRRIPVVSNGNLPSNSWNISPTSDREAIYNLRQFQSKAGEFKRIYLEESLTEDQLEKEYWRVLASPNECVEVETGYSTSFSTRRDTEHSNKVPLEKAWNLSRLPYNRGSYTNYVQENIDQIVCPKISIGMLFSTRAWHVEDFFAYKVSISHFGATRTWYSVPPKFNKRVRDLLTDPKGQQMINPSQLEQEGIPVYSIDQRPGEIVLIFSKTCNAYFDHGFNVNESVCLMPVWNWLAYGLEAEALYNELKLPPPFSIEWLLAGCLLKTQESDVVIAVASSTKPMIGALNLLLSRLKPLLRCVRLSDDAVTLRRCQVSNTLCYFAWVEGDGGSSIYCLQAFDALMQREKNLLLNSYTLYYREILTSFQSEAEAKTSKLCSCYSQLLNYLSVNPRLNQDVLEQMHSEFIRKDPIGHCTIGIFDKIQDSIKTWQDCVSKNQLLGISVKTLEDMLVSYNNCYCKDAIADALWAVACEYIMYVTQAARALQNMPSELADAIKIIELLNAEGARINIDCQEKKIILKLSKQLQWIQRTYHEMESRMSDLQVIRMLVAEGLNLGISSDSRIMIMLNKWLSIGENFDSYCHQLFLEDPSTISSQDFCAALAKSEVVPVTRETIHGLDEIKRIRLIIQAMGNPDPYRRPRYSDLAKMDITTNTIRRAMSDCEVWVHDSGFEWSQIYYQAKLASEGRYECVPRRIPVNYMMMQYRNGLQLQVLPDCFMYLEKSVSLISMLMNAGHHQLLERAGFIL